MVKVYKYSFSKGFLDKINSKEETTDKISTKPKWFQQKDAHGVSAKTRGFSNKFYRL